MSKGKRLTEYEKGKIDAFAEKNMPTREIASKIKRSKTVVSNYRRLGSNYGLKGARGRKPTLTDRVKRNIFRTCSNKSISAAQIKNELELTCNPRTIQRTIKSNSNILYRKFQCKPSLKPHHIEDRMNFARSAINGDFIWKNIVWSDEKKFNLDGPDGFRYYWHDLRKEERILSKRQQGGGSLMVWASFGYNGKSSIVMIDGILNSEKYTAMLEKHLLPFLKQINVKKPQFQHDNASIHSSKHTKKWLSDNKVSVIEWPACSPDLNPMENLWGILARRVYPSEKQYNSVRELKDAVYKAWNEIKANELEKLVNSMPDRIIEIINKKGHSINY